MMAMKGIFAEAHKRFRTANRPHRGTKTMQQKGVVAVEDFATS
jgi:hypothetical protein